MIAALNGYRRHRARRRAVDARHRFAYTLVELVTAMILGSLLIAAALRWGVGVAGVVGGSVRAGDNSQIVLAAERLADDIDGAVHCDTDGRDAVLRSLSPTSITIVADPDGDGVPALVSWRLNEGRLQRGVGALTPDCVATDPSTWSTLATQVDTDASWFRPVVGGLVSSASGDYLSCVNAATAGCATPSFTVRVMRSGYAEIVERTHTVAVR